MNDPVKKALEAFHNVFGRNKDGFGLPNKYDKYRQHFGDGNTGDGQNGFIVLPQKGLNIQFSNGEKWEHVSVSRRSKMPTYGDMQFAKDLLWDDKLAVMQLHVPKEDHVNVHPYCLHLWRPLHDIIPRPPFILVGPKDAD